MAQAQDVKRSLQIQYPRVREAFDLHEKELLKDLNIPKSGNAFSQVIVAYKLEKVLEVWVSPAKSSAHRLFRTYDFCVLSGQPGPKRKEGDGQVPEGLYHIDRFNPSSTFHLSLGINYPNASDKVLSDKKKPGGEIFIHGNCVSVGCIPITDDLIKELYVTCVLAADGGEKKIPVYIFPCKMDGMNMRVLNSNAPENTREFWKNVQTFYEMWNKNHLPLKFKVDAKGNYIPS